MRNNRALKSKSTVPIPLPHDGPIFHYLSNCEGGNDVVLEEQYGLSLALQLLLDSKSQSQDISIATIQTLQAAETAKAQLQAVQSFKSSVLNLKTKGMPISTAAADSIYRLFLEWSLSSRTTIPLQRAIHSCLKALETDETPMIMESVLKSLFEVSPTAYWNDPLHFLDVAINSPFLCDNLKVFFLDSVLSFIYHRWVQPMTVAVSLDDEQVSRGVRLSKLLKILLQPISQRHNTSMKVIPSIPYCDELEAMVVRLMNCPNVPIEGFNTLGIVYARLHLNTREHVLEAQDLANRAILSIHNLTVASKQRMVVQSSLGQLSIAQGISATLDSSTILCESTDYHSSPLETCWKYLLNASQRAVDPMARWAALKGLSTLASRWKQCSNDASAEQSSTFDGLVQETLSVTLQAWENPPLRKLGTSIPGIFQTLVEFLSDGQRQNLCQNVLDQPLNRKGRYLALDILLPYISSFKRADILKDGSLIDGVGERGPNSGAIADLWIKLLEHDWELAEFEFEQWTELWLFPLSQSLVNGDLNRRKQVLSFCVVRLFTFIRRNKRLRENVSDAAALMFDAISKTSSKASTSLSSRETHSDRILWANLELSQTFFNQKLLNSATKQVISKYVSLDTLTKALGHDLADLRLSGFETIETVVSHICGRDIETEFAMWRIYVSMTMKASDRKEQSVTIIQSLILFLDRVSIHGAKTAEDAHDKAMESMTLFFNVNDFLINELILSHGIYPGTVTEKEEFALLLLEHLVAFVLQRSSFAVDGANRNGIIFTRERHAIEKKAMWLVLGQLLTQEVFACLFSLLHTQWDSTRAAGFGVLTKLVQAAHDSGIDLPTGYVGCDGRSSLISRGMYLASSPRQREAETGSQLLAFLYMALPDHDEKLAFLLNLVDCLESRIFAMKASLQKILSTHEPRAAVEAGQNLPLAHGLIHAILLLTHHVDSLEIPTNKDLQRPCPIPCHLYERLTAIFCDALHLSLSIVADVRDDEDIEGVDKEIGELQLGSSSTPLNVNTGAIGANGTVSRLSKSAQSNQASFLGTQRIVVGTWLLIKETCAAAAAVIGSQGYSPSPSSVLSFGTLLISTMTSLKHAGAAFAARDSLHAIATTCLRSSLQELREIPKGWIYRLISELGSGEKVRDSTLRRSTGYALGFQAIMRSEFSNNASTIMELCTEILQTLVRYCLPPEKEIKRTIDQLSCLRNGQEPSSLFFSCGDTSLKDPFFIPDHVYEARTRVHALNVMRMLVLDAPLSTVVGPFIGDAIIVALLGYSDPSWAVRNSATMVFSAAMLRVVDADKNASSNSDRTSNQAITFSELFRRYPALEQILPSMLEESTSFSENQSNTQLFPILLLLSRAQPIRQSGVVATLAETYPVIVFKALGRRNHAIRAAAARALVNLSSTNRDSATSASSTLSQCVKAIDVICMSESRDWNMFDGALLVVKSLLDSFGVSGQFWGEALVELELLMVRILQQFLPSLPPICIATVLDIVTAVSLSHGATVLKICETFASKDCYSSVPGGPLMYAAVANAIVFLTKDLWHPSDEQMLECKLHILRFTFLSDILDIRMAAVKKFKKGIYGHIDEVMSDTGSNVPASTIMTKIALFILECLYKEMSGDQPHIATCRRLSRCYLELCDGFCALVGSEKLSSFEEATRGDRCRVWESAKRMVDYESFLSESKFEPHGEAFLSGNAAELMGIQIGVDLARGEPDVDRVRVFCSLVRRLNNMHASWRSRYSASKAVLTSRLLTFSRDFAEAHGVILLEILSMLQDSDPDVRSCAVQAAMQMGSLGGEDNNQMVSSILPTPTLCRLYPAAYGVGAVANKDASGRWGSLLQIIAENTRDVSERTTLLCAEFDHSCSSLSPWKISNDSASRRIFEEEDPNPSNERLLGSQLAILELLYVNETDLRSLNPKDCMNEIDGIIANLEATLQVLMNRKNIGGIVHELTRFPSIFPALHALLCTLSVLIFTGTVRNQMVENLQVYASTIATYDSLHPQIEAAANCLGTAKRGDLETKDRIRSCLFLLTY